MKNRFVLLAVALLATSCAAPAPFGMNKDPETKYIGVTVVGGLPVVSEEPALASIQRNKITWELDDSAWFAGYFFRSDGITQGSGAVAPPSGCRVEKFNDAFERCDTKKAGRELTCHRIKNVFVPGACYKYAVTLWKNGKIVLDPWIKNE